MSDELRMPPVIDLEVLLQPISEESPSGESLRYSGIYDEITEARRADDDLNQGEWVTDLKVADYNKVIDLGVPALSTQTKDLQIGVWVAEAEIRRFGFAGLRDSLLMLHGFHERFWDTVHPEIDEGDMEGRANAMSWLDENGAIAVRTAPITGVRGYSFNDYEDSKKYDFPESVDSLMPDEQKRINNLKAEAEKNRSVTASMWNVERIETRRAAMETINNTIEECWTALNDLNRICEEKYDRNQTPGFSNLKGMLDKAHEQVKKLLEEKRAEEPDEIEEEEVAGEGAEGAVGGAKGDGSVSGAIANRRDALKKLAEIAAFFHKTEPHSPVSYLVQRAVKWGNMGLESWLQEVVKDQSVLFQLRETLGVDGSSTEGSGGGAAADDPWA
ncbi:MAG: type VI secretion system protein TssA [Chloracidobacterium sp.]|nr:type VI secretion system protein TssA [Chloracidobacterium sp.]